MLNKRFHLSLALLSAAVITVTTPISVYAEETTAAVETAAASTEAESKAENANGESTAESEPAVTEEATKLAKEAGLPDGVHYADYYVLVSQDSGATMIQEPQAGSPVSINLTIPKGTLLHIVGEVIDANGHAWGYTKYADLRGGFLDMTTLTRANVQTAKEAAEAKIADPWGDLFTQVDGAGTPVSFNAVGKDELESAAESKAEAEEGADGNVTTVETNANGETVSGGNVIDASLENNETKAAETDENGETIETTEDESASEDTKGGFHLVSFIIGAVSVLGLEVLLAAIMLLLRKLKAKKRRKAEQAAEGGEGEEDAPKKKKGFSLKLPKITIKKK